MKTQPIPREVAVERLRDAFKRSGWSYSQAADRLGINRTQVIDWISGKNMPAWPTLLWLAVNLGLDMKILMPEIVRSIHKAARVKQ